MLKRKVDQQPFDSFQVLFCFACHVPHLAMNYMKNEKYSLLRLSLKATNESHKYEKNNKNYNFTLNTT